MSSYRTLNRTITAKVETTPGTDVAPTVGANAVLVESPQISGGPTPTETNEVTGALDASSPVITGAPRTGQYTVNLRGSGAGGTAPEWGVLNRGCAMSETVRAADLTGTAQAGAAASITLAVGATGIVVGDIIATTGGTGPGQTRVITAWDNGTKIALVYPDWTVTPDATTTYAVKASAIYVPASSALVNLSIYDYAHASDGASNSILRKILGAAGTVDLTFPVRGIVRGAYNYTGKFVAPTNVSHPGAATYDTQRPVAFQAADVFLGGAETRLNQVTLSMGGEVQMVDDPNDTFGLDVAGVTRRRITGRINPPATLLSSRDVIADILAGTARKLWLRYGSPGNGLSLYIPEVLPSASEDEDVNGFLHEGIPFSAQGIDGGFYLTVY